jgi:hypothetical protein
MVTRYLVNDGPAQLINGSYNAYSMLYRGQLSLGLPVSKELIVSQEEIKTRAVQKLALVLYPYLSQCNRFADCQKRYQAVITTNSKGDTFV